MLVIHLQFWTFIAIKFWTFIAITQAFEWPIITFKHKHQCTTNETFNIQSLNCEICSSNYAVPSKSGKPYYNKIKS